MNLFKAFFASLLVLICGASLTFLSACRQPLSLNPKSRTQAAVRANLSAVNVFKQDPAIIEGTLANGFKYILMRNQEPRDRVSIHLNVHVGSFNEEDSEQGIAHYLEHMLFCGTTHFPPGELVKFFQRIGMEFGGDANAHTGFFATVYDILLPKGNSEQIADALQVIKDYAQGALLLPSEVARERQIILAEKRTRDSASYRTFVETLKFEAKDARIAQRLPIGREAILRQIDAQRLKTFYDTWYRPDNMQLVAVGDFDEKIMRDTIHTFFADLKSRAPQKKVPEFGDIKHFGVEPFFHYENEAGNVDIQIKVLTRIPKPLDTFANRVKWLKIHLANDLVRQRFKAMLSKNEAPFTTATASAGIYFNQLQYGYLAAECQPENWRESLAQLEKELRRALTFGFTNAELIRAQKEFIAYLENEAQAAPTRNSQSLSRMIIQETNQGNKILSPAQELALFQPVIHALSSEDLLTAFREEWQPNHRLIMVTGNLDLASGEKSPEALILDTYNASSQSDITPPTPEKTVRFPYRPLPTNVGKINRNILHKDIGVRLLTFKNGVRVHLKKTDFKANEILFKLIFGKGRSEEPKDLQGIAHLSQMVVNESGLGGLTREELQRALAGKNTAVSFSIAENAFVFYGSTVPDEIELAFQLLVAHLKDPGFRSEARDLSLERYRLRYAAQEKSIDAAMALKGDRFLAGGDHRFGLPQPSVLSRVSLADIVAWLTPPLAKDPIEIAIVGDFDVDLLVEQAARYFGTLDRPGGRVIPSMQIPQFPQGGHLALNIPTKIQKGIVMLAFPTSDFWDIDKTRRFSVLGKVFTERMRQQIRVKMGAAYAAFAYHLPSQAYQGYGAFRAMAMIAPEDNPAVLARIEQIANDLGTKGVSEEELSRALKPILTGIKDMRRTNEYWLNSVLSGLTEHPAKLDWSRNILKGFKAISAQELSHLASEYLVLDKAATLIITPENSTQ